MAPEQRAVLWVKQNYLPKNPHPESLLQIEYPAQLMLCYMDHQYKVIFLYHMDTHILVFLKHRILTND